MLTFEEFCKSVLIVMTTFNRKKVTEICLKQLEATKKEATLWVVDDHSTEMTLTEIQNWAPKATVKQIGLSKMGITPLRLEIQKQALLTSFKYIYHTDNDAYHDPQWLLRFYEMHKDNRDKGMLGLYNTSHHFCFTIGNGENVIYRSACPGVSFFYEIAKLNPLPEKFYNSWDFVFGDILKTAAISIESYVEHFGAGGINNADFERDRAHKPTPWLIQERGRLLPLLK